jgi:hypothetical protein
MNMKIQVEPVLEDAATFTEFINIIGDISETLYLATHSEENDKLLVHAEPQSDSLTSLNEYPDLRVPCHAELQEAYL